MGPVVISTIIIGPKSIHCNWLCLSVTESLTNCRLVNLIDVTLAREDANPKLVEVVTVAYVDDENRVKLATVCCRFGN